MSEVRAAELGGRVHRARLAAGLSQEELASRAGISRQALGALERGRHLPRVDAAINLARALGTSVETLVGARSTLARDVLFGVLGEGQPVRAARVGERVVATPVPGAGEGEQWGAADGVIRYGTVEPFDRGELDAFVLVGCDPAIGMMAQLGPPSGSGRLLGVSASSAAAHRALVAGRAHAAVVHDRVDAEAADGDPSVPADGPEDEDRPDTHTAADPGPAFPLARWRVGIAAPAEAPDRLAAALRGECRVVQRDAGAGAQAAFERALRREGATTPAGPLAAGHLDAAMTTRRTGEPSVTIEPVARAVGLAFHPLELHAVTLLIGADHLDHAGARVLAELLGGVRLRRRLLAFEGYELPT